MISSISYALNAHGYIDMKGTQQPGHVACMQRRQPGAPHLAARCRGVSSAASEASTQAPLPSRKSTTAACLPSTAQCSGVRPPAHAQALSASSRLA